MRADLSARRGKQYKKEDKTMKKFVISSGCNIENSVPKEYVEQYSKQEMLNNYVGYNLYELENTIFETENEEQEKNSCRCAF